MSKIRIIDIKSTIDNNPYYNTICSMQIRDIIFTIDSKYITKALKAKHKSCTEHPVRFVLDTIGNNIRISSILCYNWLHFRDKLKYEDTVVVYGELTYKNKKYDIQLFKMRPGSIYYIDSKPIARFTAILKFVNNTC